MGKTPVLLQLEINSSEVSDGSLLKLRLRHREHSVNLLPFFSSRVTLLHNQ